MTEAMPPSAHQTEFPIAASHKRRFAAIWLIPVVAALIAGYLALHSYSEHGPLITISFKTADFLVAGQTQLRYKAVTLGTVEYVKLKDDLSGVSVAVRMASNAEPLLTDHARFWVVRPRLNSINVSDLQTLVTGSYIQIDPGAEGGQSQRDFTGLETPPADRSDQPGRTFMITTASLDALNIGSPVYYRGIEVGEVQDFSIGNGFDPIAVQIFVRSPYDHYISEHTAFWNASGLSLNIGPGGIHLATHSIRTVLSGGISFFTPATAQNDKEASSGASFHLYDSEQQAEQAQYRAHIPLVTYFENSIKDLGLGSPVVIYGLQAGVVTSIDLVVDAATNAPKVRVGFELQPDRIFGSATATQGDPTVIMQRLVATGMRVKLESSNLLFGQKMLTLEFQPGAAPAAPVRENDALVVPSQSGSADNVIDALGDVADKLNQIPFAEIGANLNHLIAGADKILGGAEAAQTMHALSTAMANAADLTQKADKNLTPVLQQLPAISEQLQSAVTHANGLMAGLDQGYGEGSDFARDAKRTLDQVNDAARSIRLLADFLERHPESILSGKTPEPPKDKP